MDGPSDLRVTRLSRVEATDPRRVRRRYGVGPAESILAFVGMVAVAVGVGPFVGERIAPHLAGRETSAIAHDPPDPVDPPASSSSGPTTTRPPTTTTVSTTSPTTTITPTAPDRPPPSTSVDPSLADLLPPIDRGAAIPELIEPRPRPVGMQISTIDVSSYPIRSVGLDDLGALEIPDETEIGWYRYGASAGDPGATVLAAHVSWNGTTGPFFALATVDPGDTVEVTLDDGSRRHYEVVERAIYGKNELPRERIWRTTGPESLVLITCGGDFNPEIRRYRQNIVVFAVPIG